MKLGVRHVKGLFMAVVLLCMAFSSVKVSASTFDMSGFSASADSLVEMEVVASFSEKKDNTLDVVHEMGRWGIPSSSVTLHSSEVCSFMLGNALLRMFRSFARLYACSLSCLDDLTEMLSHTIFTKRFHSGYYLHCRCQMRC